MQHYKLRSVTVDFHGFIYIVNLRMGELLGHFSQAIIMETSLVRQLLALSSGRLTVKDSMVRKAASHMKR